MNAALLLSIALFEPAVRGPELDVAWEAPDECGDAESVRAHARARLGAEPIASVVARGRVRQLDGGTWILEIELEGRRGSETREIRASSCAALDEAAGLLVAVAADPAATPGEPTRPDVALPEPERPPPEPSPPPAPDVSTMTRPAAGTPPSSPPPRSRDRRIDGALRAEASARFARVLPQAVGVGFGGAAVLRFAAARLELRAQHALAQRIRDEDVTGVGGTFSLTTGSIVGCWAPRRGRLEFPLCAGLELGAIRGRSFGVARDGEAWSSFAAAPIEGGIIVSPVPRIGLVALAGVAPTLRRPSFHLRDRDPLFVAGPVGVRVGLGVELRFP